MLTTSRILSFISEEQGIELKKLEKSLKLSKKSDRDRLQIALNALKKLDIIEGEEATGNIKLSNKSKCIKARVRCSSKGYSFAVREDEGDDIYIRDYNLNNAWHGDLVLLKVTKEAFRRRSFVFDII